MTDLNTFEHRLAAEVQREYGPEQPFDAMAIVDAAAAPSRRWQVAAAGRITAVAAAGALAVMVIMTIMSLPRSSEQGPASDAAALATTLEAEQVAPGVWRQAQLGIGTDSWRAGAEGQVAADSTGGAWFARAGSAASMIIDLRTGAESTTPDSIGNQNLLDLRTTGETIWLAGDRGIGTLADGAAWVVVDAVPLALELTSDGSALLITSASSRGGAHGEPVLVSVAPDGVVGPPVSLPPGAAEHAFDGREFGALDVADTADATFVGLHSLDGGGLWRLPHGSETRDWVQLEPLGIDVDVHVNALSASRDGEVLWALLLVESEVEPERDGCCPQWDPVLARHADGEWRTWGPDDGLPLPLSRHHYWNPLPLEVAPDGSVVIGHFTLGPVHFDGSTWTIVGDSIDEPGALVEGVGDLAVTADGSIVALITVADRREHLGHDGSVSSITYGSWRQAAVYVIDPSMIGDPPATP